MKLNTTPLCLLLTALQIPHALSLSTTTTTSSTAPTISPRVAFANLDESSFRHPLDRDLTSRIKSAPFSGIAQEGLRRTFPVVEEAVRLDLLSTSVKVSPQQLPEIHELLIEACEVLYLIPGRTSSNNNQQDNKKIPELYIQSSSQANAYTLALRGRSAPPIVVVTSALLDQCTEPEIQAILGHELGHLKCEHALYLTLGGLASTPIRNLPFLGSSADNLLQRWRLAAEYTCDRAALLVAQDPKVVAGALLKLFAGTSKYSMSTEAFVAQCVEYDELLKSANPLVRASIQRQQRTHPLPVRRVAELEKWSESVEYKSILKSGTEMSSYMTM